MLVQVKALGHKALTITNVPGSTLSREADYTLLLHAGPEIAVASTKAYTCNRQRFVTQRFDLNKHSAAVRCFSALRKEDKERLLRQKRHVVREFTRYMHFNRYVRTG